MDSKEIITFVCESYYFYETHVRIHFSNLKNLKLIDNKIITCKFYVYVYMCVLYIYNININTMNIYGNACTRIYHSLLFFNKTILP